MTKHVGEQGRDAVLHEKKLTQRHLIQQHRQRRALWEKVIGYFASSHRAEQNGRQKERFQKLYSKRNQNDLEWIFTKLKDCCDEGETELREAIKYGLKIISAAKHRSEGSKADSYALGDHSSSHVNHPSRHPPLT
jgi:hypothetical protein